MIYALRLLMFCLLLLHTHSFAYASEVLLQAATLEAHTFVSEDERLFLEELGELQVMVDPDYRPISYYNAKTARFEGIFVEVLEALSKRMGFRYHIIRDKELSWSDRLTKVRNNRVHILGGASKNSKREEYGYFVEQPYFTINYALIKLIDNYVYIGSIRDINNYKLGLSRGLTIESYLLRHLNADTTLLYYKSSSEALQALKRREIDLYPYNEAVFKEHFFEGSLIDFEIAYSIQEVRKEYAFFCPKTETGLRLSKLLDEGMSHIDVNRIIAERYQNKSSFAFYKGYLEDMQRESAYKNIVVIVFIMLSLAGLVIAIIMKREDSKKAALIEKLEKLKQQLQELASHDILTGLPNRLLFQDRLLQALLLSKRSKKKCAIFYMDLDGFKQINDLYGHAIGDKLLVACARKLETCVRASDTVARMGGDEYIILLSNIDTSEYPKLVAQRILQALSDPFIIDGISCSVGICIGISLYPDDSQSIERLLSMADDAMYHVKRSGKNSFAFASETGS